MTENNEKPTTPELETAKSTEETQISEPQTPELSVDGQIIVPDTASPPAVINLDEELKKPLSADEAKAVKERKKEEKRKKQFEKQKELEKMATEIVEKQFMKAFDKRTLPYTIMFTVLTGILGIFTLLYSVNNAIGPQIQWWQITLSLSSILCCILLLNISRKKSFHDSLFSEGNGWFKVIFVVIGLILGFLLCYLYWSFTDSDPNIIGLGAIVTYRAPPFEFLRYQDLFGVILIVLFFGWNLIQIFFIKNGLESTALKVEVKFRVKSDDLPTADKNRRTGMVNLLCLTLPIVFHFLFTFLFIYYDTAKAWNWLLKISDDPAVIASMTALIAKITKRFTPTNQHLAPSDFFTEHPEFVSDNWWIQSWNYFNQVWLMNSTMQNLLIWFVVVLIVIIAMTVHQKKLFAQSYENKTPNVFSGVFYLLFWIVFWLKCFLLLRAAIIIPPPTATPGTAELDLNKIFDYVIDFLLMLITIFMAIRSFATKLRNLKTPWLSPFNSIFLMFLFVVPYFGGQMVLITGGAFTDTKAISTVMNFVLSIVNVTFYFWYSSWIIERRGFSRKMSFTVPEARSLLLEYAQEVKGNLLQTIENEEIITSTLNNFLLNKHIIMEKPPKGEEGLVSNLAKEEKQQSSAQRLSRVQDAYQVAKQDQKAYDDGVERLESAKARLRENKNLETNINNEIAKFPSDLNDQYQAADQNKSNAQAAFDTLQQEIASQIQQMNAIQIPTAGPAGITPEMKSEIDDKTAQKTAFEKKIADLSSQKPALETTLQTNSTKFMEIKAIFDACNSKKSELKSIQELITTIEKEIAALEIDLVTLKDRADESRPTMDAAKIALNSAELELDAFNLLEKAKVEEKDAQDKLKIAQEKETVALGQLKSAQDWMARTKTIEQAKADIAAAEADVAAKEQQVNNAKVAVAKAKADLDEKTLASVNAQVVVNEKQKLADFAENEIKTAQIALEKAVDSLKRGEQIQKDLENARAHLKELEKVQSKLDTVEIAETKLKNAQNTEKEAKAKYKEVKKTYENEPGTPVPLQDAQHAVDDASEALTLAKENYKKVKDAQAETDSARKRMNSLESQQIDLPATKKEIESNEKTLKELDEKAKIPRAELADAMKKLDDAKSAQSIAKDALNTTTAAEIQAEQELSKAQSNKSAALQSLAEREDAEKALKNAEEQSSKGNVVLSKAQENLTEKEKIRSEKELAFRTSVDVANADWSIYIAEVELKQAHKTFKDAVRSAENNVKVREQRLADAKSKKENLGKSPQEVTTPSVEN